MNAVLAPRTWRVEGKGQVVPRRGQLIPGGARHRLAQRSSRRIVCLRTRGCILPLTPAIQPLAGLCWTCSLHLQGLRGGVSSAPGQRTRP
jgi:hypothetical protein